MSELHEPHVMMLNAAMRVNESSQKALDTIQVLLHAPNLDHITTEEWKAALGDLHDVIMMQKVYSSSATEHISDIYDRVEKSLEEIQKK